MGAWIVFLVHGGCVLGIVLSVCATWWLWLRPAEPRRRERPRFARRPGREAATADRPAAHAAGPGVRDVAPVYARGGD